jgi:hypothetical protein
MRYENLYYIVGHKKYEILPNGKVRSIKKDTFIPQMIGHDGYRYIDLIAQRKNGNKCQFSYMVHILVAMVFLPNPNNYDIAIHKDRNKENNHVDNIMWVSEEEYIKLI